jgi:transcriptional regulator with GAF, ATPase, and Fis domain
MPARLDINPTSNYNDRFTQVRKNEVERMKRKTDAMGMPTQIVDVWQQLVDSISTLLSVPSVMINHLEPPELDVFLSNVSRENPFPSGSRMPLSGVYCEATVRTRQKNQVEDALQDTRWADSPTAKIGIVSYLGFPIFWPNGDVFGTICAVDTKANKWVSPSDTLLQTVKNAVEAHLALLAAMEDLNKKNQALEIAFSEVKTLRGLLPICTYCKKIRDDKGYWNQLESYIGKHSDATFSHGVCPECLAKEIKRIKPG